MSPSGLSVLARPVAKADTAAETISAHASALVQKLANFF